MTGSTGTVVMTCDARATGSEHPVVARPLTSARAALRQGHQGRDQPRVASSSSRTTRRSCSRPASTCVSTGTSRTFVNHRYTHIDPATQQDDLTAPLEVEPDESFVLHPGEFVLGSTYEVITLPDDVAGRLEGKSSLGRLGLLTHSTAGFIDPGFSGHVTLELSNVANLPIVLWPGMKVGQLCLFRLTSPAEHPYGSPVYGSRYQGQRGPTPVALVPELPEGPVLTAVLGIEGWGPALLGTSENLVTTHVERLRTFVGRPLSAVHLLQGSAGWLPDAPVVVTVGADQLEVCAWQLDLSVTWDRIDLTAPAWPTSDRHVWQPAEETAVGAEVVGLDVVENSYSVQRRETGEVVEGWLAVGPAAADDRRRSHDLQRARPETASRRRSSRAMRYRPLTGR